MNQFNHLFPFAINLTFSSIDAETGTETVIDPLTFEFKLVYEDAVGTEYEVSHLGDVYKNCYVQDGKLFARFENHNFAKGDLKKELFVDYIVSGITAGEGFENGYWSNSYPMTSDIKMI